MTNNKLIFFDIDGTLLDHEMRIPESTRSAVQTLKKDGHTVAIATGRPPYLFKHIRDELDINSFVCLNGQYAVLEGKTVHKNPIPKDVLNVFTDMAARNKHPLLFMGEEDMKTNVDQCDVIAECMSTLGAAHPDYGPDFYKDREIYQTLIFCEDTYERQYLEMKDLDFIRWHKYSMDVLPGGGSKAIGIKKIMNCLGYQKADVFAFGDNLNDIEMLKFVGHGVAMGNAPKIVKAAAKYVTTDVGQDGIANGLELVGLLK